MADVDEEAEEYALGRERLVSSALAALYWSGAAADWHATARDALGWLAEAWGAGDEHLPLTLVHDLGLLLREGHAFRLASGRDLGAWPTAEQAARLAYEERVLGRWLLDPSVDAAHVALSGVPPARRDAFLVHAIRLALTEPTLGARLRLTGNAAHVRSLGEAVITETPTRFEDWAALDDAWLTLAADAHAAAVDALPAGPLFGPEDLWELNHFGELHSESQRLALRQLHGVAARIGPLHASVAGRLRRSAREIPVEAEEADRFPAGGFDALSHQGRFENLVRSEVAYVGEGGEGVDAFDIRYVVGELLYYTRDESPLLDAHRHVTVVVDDLAGLRQKHPELPVQALVLVAGLYLALHADLARAFSAQAASTTLRWRLTQPADVGIAAEEEVLLRTSLGTELRHHRVRLGTLDADAPWPAAPLLVMSPRLAPPRLPPGTVWLQVDGAAIALTLAGRGRRDRARSGARFSAVTDLRRALNATLGALLGAGLDAGPGER